jgi:hypothetical protein
MGLVFELRVSYFAVTQNIVPRNSSISFTLKKYSISGFAPDPLNQHVHFAVSPGE